jgi:hypothetical protein
MPSILTTRIAEGGAYDGSLLAGGTRSYVSRIDPAQESLPPPTPYGLRKTAGDASAKWKIDEEAG